MAPLRQAGRLPAADDRTSREDLAVFLAGWRRHRAWAMREEPFLYDVRLVPLLARMEEHLTVLRLHAAVPAGAFLAEPWRAEAARHRLFLAFVAVIDSTKWLAGRARLRGRPRSLAEAFDLLIQAGALPPEQRRFYLGLARLRNGIAHEAVALPPRKVRALLRFHLPGLEAHAALLRRFSGV